MSYSREQRLERPVGRRLRLTFLIVAMTLVAFGVVIVTVMVLYRAAFDGQRARLVETARGRARMIESVAAFNAIHSPDYPGGSFNATLAQITGAHAQFEGFGQTGEFTLARREGDFIVFLMRHRHSDLDTPAPVPIQSQLAEPMRRALRGESGIVVGPDYRGETVLAAYEPLSGLNIGIVAKIDLTEVRAPFFRAGALALAIAAALIGVGGVLFRIFIEPLFAEIWSSEDKYRSLFERSTDAISVIGVAGEIEDGNAALHALLGYEQGELIGKNVLELHVDPERRRKLTEEVAARGFVRDFEAKLRQKAGTEVDCLLTASRRTGKDGEVVGYETIIRDVTERRRTEEQLRYKATMLSSMDDAVVTADMNLAITGWNVGAERMFGRRADEVLGKTMTEVATIEYQDITREEVLAAVRADGVWRGELVYRNAGGNSIQVLTVGTLVRDADGEPIGIVAVHRDITEWKQAQQDLIHAKREVQTTAERDRAILGAVPDILMEVNSDKVYTWANKSGLEFFGDDVLGKEAAHYFVGEQDTYDRVEPLLQGDADHLYVESWQRRKDGEARLLAWTCRNLRAGGEMAGALSSARDITEIRRVEEDVRRLNAELEARVNQRTAELRAANKELEVFAYSISHDLKAPLRAMTGFSEIIAERYHDSLEEEARRYFEHIHRAGTKMTTMVDDLLHYSRLGRAAVESRDVELSEVFSSVVNACADELEELNGTIDVPDDLPVAQGASSLLLRVFDNLVCNAIRYRKPDVPPVVQVGWCLQDGRLSVSVADNGIGISEEHHDKIFDLFQRLHGDDAYSGSGIGLAMVQKAVTILGGSVGVESEVGQGSTFTVHLPAVVGVYDG